MGTPDEVAWPGVSTLPDFKTTFPRWHPQPLSRVVPGLCDAGLDLLAKLLVYEPSKRISTKEALAHPYFDELDELEAALPRVAAGSALSSSVDAAFAY